MFTTRHEWFEHESQMHRREWVCEKCEKNFLSADSFTEHVQSQHSTEIGNHRTSDIAETCMRPVDRNHVSDCPLCLKPSQYIRSHLSKHMRTIALFVLPPASDESGEGTESNQALRSGSEGDEDASLENVTSLGQESTGSLQETAQKNEGSARLGGRWADFNLDGDSGIRSLLHAARLGHIDIVRVLVNEVTIDINARDSRGQTALSLAAEAGNMDVVSFLLEVDGVDPNTVDTVFRRTPLSWAAAGGHVGIVRLLVMTFGVDVNARDSYGRTPLWRAASAGHVEVMRVLLRVPHIEPDAKDRYSRTPLSLAAAGGHNEIVLLLAGMPGVDVNSKEPDSGYTPLSRAAALGRLEVVKSLLSIQEIQVNEPDNLSQTPLSKAAENGHADTMSMLAQIEGVNTACVDAHGKTPLDWAKVANHNNISGGWRCCECSRSGRVTEIPPTWRARCPICHHTNITPNCQCATIA